MNPTTIPAAPVTITEIKPGPKPGVRTTEFWLTLLVQAGALAGVVADKLPGLWGAVAAAVAAGAYSLSRGLAKS